MLTAAPQACYGLAQAAFKPLLHAGRPYLPSCLPWRPLLRGWRALSSQHDVCEFMAHLLSIAEPSAYEGLWQSRLTNPFLVTAADPLAAPILLPITGSSLQALVDSWSQQASIQALTRHSGVVMLQLERYGILEGRPSKNSNAVPIQPGESVVLPVFATNHDTELSHMSFRVAYVIYHRGQSTQSGHYQTALCFPRGGTSCASWQFHICNDDCTPRLAKPSDLRDIHCNGYLVGLVWDAGFGA